MQRKQIRLGGEYAYGRTATWASRKRVVVVDLGPFVVVGTRRTDPIEIDGEQVTDLARADKGDYIAVRSVADDGERGEVWIVPTCRICWTWADEQRRREHEAEQRRQAGERSQKRHARSRGIAGRMAGVGVTCRLLPDEQVARLTFDELEALLAIAERGAHSEAVTLED